MKCWKCNEVEIDEPEYCCNDYACGCMGKPVDPPYCDDCWEELTEQTKELPQAIKATESPSHVVTEAEAFGDDCPNGSCS